VSRTIETHSEAKLIKAGADAVVSPNAIGGQRLATLALKPAIMSFLDIVHYPGEEEITINIQELKISPVSCLVGLSQKDADIRNRTGLTILGVFSGENKIFNPPLDLVFQAGDILLAFGTEEQIEKLKEFCEQCK
jgi:voltage-gated potassium channel